MEGPAGSAFAVRLEQAFDRAASARSAVLRLVIGEICKLG
jgi:hypothetical protein